MHSLVIQTSFLGDMVLTTPLIARLAEDGPVDVVSTPGAAGLLDNHPAIRRVLIYDKRGKDRGPTGFTRLAGEIRAGQYDAVYLAQGSMRSSALALLSRVPKRIGFDTSAGRALYTSRLPYVETDHHARRLLSLAGDIGVADANAIRPRLYPGAAERAVVDALLADVNRSMPLFVLAPGSVWATKCWPGYAALAAELGTRGTVVTTGSTADHELGAAIAKAAGVNAVDAIGRLSLLASAELIRRATVLVTNDSAPQHLGSAMNTPTVTIFGPTVAAFGFGPLAEKSAVASVETLTCRPCDRHGPMTCPLGHWKCMRELSAAQVLESVRKLAN